MWIKKYRHVCRKCDSILNNEAYREKFAEYYQKNKVYRDEYQKEYRKKKREIFLKKKFDSLSKVVLEIEKKDWWILNNCYIFYSN